MSMTKRLYHDQINESREIESPFAQPHGEEYETELLEEAEPKTNQELL